MNTPQNDGGPIAANICKQIPMGDNIYQTEVLKATGGLSIHDWFAGMALQGLLSSQRSGKEYTTDQRKRFRVVAKESFQFADAMLAARYAELDKDEKMKMLEIVLDLESRFFEYPPQVQSVIAPQFVAMAVSAGCERSVAERRFIPVSPTPPTP